MRDIFGSVRASDKKWAIFLSLLFILLVAALLYFRPGPFGGWIEVLEHKSYDLKLRRHFHPLPQNPSVVIVALDDKSLLAEGRLPWSREKMGQITDRLRQSGAKVVAFDFMFPVPQTNSDADAIFGESLKKQLSVLGFFLSVDETSSGILPAPLLQGGDFPFILEKNSYLGNIEILQNAARFGGFLNSTPDGDGAIRFSPLIYRNQTDLFGSLALIAAQQFLDIKEVKPISKMYGNTPYLQEIQLGSRLIPVDLDGRILVPYRGPALSFPMFSATDVLNGKSDPEVFRGKLVLIGATATGSGDLYPTAAAPRFPGIEIHASIAQGIIDNYFPYSPDWGKGVSVLLILFLGLPLAILLPKMKPTLMIFLFGLILLALIFLNRWLWIDLHLSLSFVFPILTLSLLFLFHLAYGYISEASLRQKIKTIFGQYVSEEHIDLLLKQPNALTVTGENKEMSVLFSDIRHFTTMAEKMSASETTQFLNEYFTAMTTTIFEHSGTIDKYIGDAVMAFWGAPLEDPKNSLHAVSAGLAMQEKVKKLNIPDLEIGVGISTGMMYVGDMGSKFRRSYTVLGDKVNLGSRLEGLTKFYGVGVIVSEKTREETKTEFLFKKLDRVQVKGKHEAVQIYFPLSKMSEATPEMREEVKLHDEAMEAYLGRNWEKAKELWKQLEKISKTPKLYAQYIKRLETIPGPDWDGVEKFS